MANFNSFKSKFRIEELMIASVGSVSISLRPEQVTLGSMIVAVNRSVTSLSDLSRHELADVASAVSFSEKIARFAYHCDKFNSLFLMMVDPFVHAHCVPRYAQTLARYGTEWQDEDWPGPPVLRPAVVEEGVLNKMLSELRSCASRLEI